MAVTIKLKLEKPCKLWTGRTTEKGYGELYYKGHRERAHRVAYAEANGLTMDAIEGVTIRHKCDTPACIEPTHLLAGTHDDNMRDMDERGHRVRGEKHGMAKLTADQVRAIREQLRNGIKCDLLAKQYSVSLGAITGIQRGVNWRHVQ
ncbi:HNH endonuclease [Paraburkholderia xenovorans]|uniref:HNH endonuclease n=1 Tax=Paraburkholderia xenovorans TaxID=36873 RepID=UPI0015593058|nr:HNH endonuclease [Paraburkholderia xenovorans]